jgi:alpha-galactosidase
MVDRGLLTAGYDYFVIDDGWQHAHPGRRSARPRPRPLPRRGWTGWAIRSDSVACAWGSTSRLDVVLALRSMKAMASERVWAATDTRRKTSSKLLGWGVELLKYDWCRGDSCGTGINERARLHQDGRADRPGSHRHDLFDQRIRRIAPLGVGPRRRSHVARTTLDLSPRWWHILWHAHRTQRWSHVSRPGAVNDPDMLVAGLGSITGPAAWSHVAMWAMLAAPLFAGNDLRKSDGATIKALCDPTLISLAQDPLVSAGQIIARRPGLDVWERRTKSGRARLIVNQLPVARSVSLDRWGRDGWRVRTHEGEGAFSTRLRLPGRGSVLLLEANLGQ